MAYFIDLFVVFMCLLTYVFKPIFTQINTRGILVFEGK